MAIRDSEILDVTPTKLNRTESLYVVNVFKGLGTTLRHCFQNIGRNGANKDTLWVVQYPEQRREQRDVEDGGIYKPYFRGVHRLNKDEDGRVRCVACFMCQTACPAHCIHIVADESPWPDREKYPKQFDITPVYDVTGLSRQELIFDKAKLLEMYDRTVADKPM
jgi:NADH-quinone oxidoreductase subunit I